MIFALVIFLQGPAELRCTLPSSPTRQDPFLFEEDKTFEVTLERGASCDVVRGKILSFETRTEPNFHDSRGVSNSSGRYRYDPMHIGHPWWNPWTVQP